MRGSYEDGEHIFGSMMLNFVRVLDKYDTFKFARAIGESLE